jgi:hypothetical protein
MHPRDAAGVPDLIGAEASVVTKITDPALLAPAPGQWSPGDAVVCGQSRTTIKARHFAALIGRLWIGGY